MNQKRQLISSGGKWEPIIGYSRAVRVGNLVFVSGTTAANHEGRATGDAYEQTMKALLMIQSALESAGSSLRDVVRTRIFVKNIDDWQAIGRAHAEAFGEIRPAATMVEVSRFISPDIVVEIEVDAVIP